MYRQIMKISVFECVDYFKFEFLYEKYDTLILFLVFFKKNLKFEMIVTLKNRL